MAAQATVVHTLWDESFEGLMGRVASCFPRREPRLTCRNMVQGLLMVKDSANCWSPAEAIGHRSAAAWTVEQLGDREVVLVVDETGDEKSSLDAVGIDRRLCLAADTNIGQPTATAAGKTSRQRPSHDRNLTTHDLQLP
ncbi:hypothetical protein ACWC0A_31845 [Streptomyces scopuliridis]